MADLAPGVEKENSLRAAGFGDDEVGAWKSETSGNLVSAGFNSEEVDNYFGVKNPNMAPIKKAFKDNFDQHIADTTNPVEGQPAKRKAESFKDAIEVGYQGSVTGLIKRGAAPDVVLPEDAPMFYRIASQVSELAGDIPAMLAGSEIGAGVGAPTGAALGSVVPVMGTAAGAAGGAVFGGGYGALALSTGVKKALMDHYEKGDVKDFQDFWERSAATFIAANKAGITGGLTAGAGAAIKIGAPIANAALKTTAQLSAEVATMVTVGKGLEGQIPEPQDFLDAAILVGGLHAVTSGISSKARKTYAETGVKPEDLALRAQSDPLIKQDLLIEENKIPDVIAKENGIPVNQEIAKAPDKEVPTTEALPRSEAEQKILSKVGEAKDLGEKVTLKGAWNTGYATLLDRLDPIKEAVKILADNPKELPADKNPYQLARMANDYKSKAKYVFEKGTLDFKTLADTGEGLNDILDPIKKDPQGFTAYLLAKRAIEVEGKEKVSGFDLEAAKQVVAEGKDKYEDTAQKFYDFKNKNLEYLKDSGVIGQKEFDNMVEMNKAHVSFSRILDAEKGGSVGGKGLGSLKEFKGSNLSVQDPILSTIENTQSIIKAAEKNRAVSAFVDLDNANPDKSLLTKVETPKSKLLDNQFEVFRDGEREVYEAPKDVAKAIKALDGDVTSTNIALRIMRGLTGFKKLSLTLTPEFITKNVFRDQLTAGTFSQGGGIPVVDTAIAMKDIISKDDAYYNWLKSGGGGAAFLDLNKDYLENNIFKLNKETGLLDKAWNVVKTPIHYLEMTGALTEQATRLAEFKRVAKGETSGEKVFAGGFASREVTVDFQRMGSALAATNSITAFQNVSLQGLDRTLRAIKDDPVGVTAKAVVSITVPSMLLWWYNKDDKRYEDIPRWQKDTFWIVLTDNWQKAEGKEAEGLPDHLVRQNNGQTEINKGTIYRIPKPQELGILFGSLIERLLEAYFKDNPNAMKDFNETMHNLIVPSIVPDAIAPFREQKYNQSLFTGNKIVPGYLEGIAPEYQYTEYTSESAKQLAKLVRFMPGTPKPGELSLSSPMVVDNYIRSWSGNLGVYATQLADKALIKAGAVPDPQLPASTLADIPFVKAFVVRYPSAGAQSIQDFYDNYAKQKEKFDTIKHLGRTGDIEDLEKELNGVANGDEAFVKLDGIKKALTAQAQFIRLVYKNPDYTPSDKRQLIDGVYYGMIEATREGNDLLNELNKIMKNKGK